jgi:hypothetical protein
LTIFDRAIMTILVWGLLLEILSVIYLSSTPSRFEFVYSLFLLALTSIVLMIMIWRLKRSTSKKPPRRQVESLPIPDSDMLIKHGQKADDNPQINRKPNEKPDQG